MRFKFCWDCDCPDWVLGEIVSMSKMNPNEFEPLVFIANKSILGDDSVTKDLAQLAEKYTGQKHSGILAAVHWILESAAGSSTPVTVLSSELLQLGLRKDHSSLFIDHYRQNVDELKEHLKNQSLKESKNLKFVYQVKDIQIGKKIESIAEIKFNGDIYVQDTKNTVHKDLAFNITKEQAFSLFYEMTEADKIMEELLETEK